MIGLLIAAGTAAAWAADITFTIGHTLERVSYRAFYRAEKSR